MTPGVVVKERVDPPPTEATTLFVDFVFVGYFRFQGVSVVFQECGTFLSPGFRGSL